MIGKVSYITWNMIMAAKAAIVEVVDITVGLRWICKIGKVNSEKSTGFHK